MFSQSHGPMPPSDTWILDSAPSPWPMPRPAWATLGAPGPLCPSMPLAVMTSRTAMAADRVLCCFSWTFWLRFGTCALTVLGLLLVLRNSNDWPGNLDFWHRLYRFGYILSMTTCSFHYFLRHIFGQFTLVFSTTISSRSALLDRIS